MDKKRKFDDKEYKQNYNKNWYAANKQSVLARNKEWCAKNAERRREQQKCWNANNKEKIREVAKKWRLEHKDELKKKDAGRVRVKKPCFSPNVYVVASEYNPYVKVGFTINPGNRLHIYRTRDRTENFILLVPVLDKNAEELVLAELRKCLTWKQEDVKSELFLVTPEDRDLFCFFIVKVIVDNKKKREI